MSENNNKQYLVSYFYEHFAFLRVFFIKELPCSLVVHTFFDPTGNTVEKIVQCQHLNQYINIYLVFLLFYCDCQKFNLTGDFLDISVHGDWQRNNIYLQRCWDKSCLGFMVQTPLDQAE